MGAKSTDVLALKISLVVAPAGGVSVFVDTLVELRIFLTITDPEFAVEVCVDMRPVPGFV